MMTVVESLVSSMFPNVKKASITKEIRAKEKKDRIRAKAYEIWEKRGNTGTPEENWNAAIKALKKQIFFQPFISLWFWTGLNEKRGWDIITGLSIPLVIFFGGQYFTYQNNVKQQQISDEKIREERLNKYLDVMEKDLSDLKGNKSIKKILDTIRTSTTLNALDGSRKRQLLLFLKGASLIAYEEPVEHKQKVSFRDKYKPLAIISLDGADLSQANLNKVDLSNTDLSGVNLKKANLEEANLSNVNFTNADLEGAELNYTFQQNTVFCNTKMTDGTIDDTNCHNSAYVDASNGMLVRESPAGVVIGSLRSGQRVSLTSLQQYKDSHMWSQISTGGWVASDYLSYGRSRRTLHKE